MQISLYVVIHIYDKYIYICACTYMHVYVCADDMTLRKDKHDIKKRYLYMCTQI